LFFYKESMIEKYGDSWKELLEANLIERLPQ